jgi:hypothetical protein
MSKRDDEAREAAWHAFHEQNTLLDHTTGNPLVKCIFLAGYDAAMRAQAEGLRPELAARLIERYAQERTTPVAVALETVRCTALDYEAMARDEGRARQGDQFAAIAELAMPPPGRQQGGGT